MGSLVPALNGDILRTEQYVCPTGLGLERSALVLALNFCLI